MRDGNWFLLIWCVFRWFWRNEVKCYASVQVTYLLDRLIESNEISPKIRQKWIKNYLTKPKYFLKKFCYKQIKKYYIQSIIPWKVWHHFTITSYRNDKSTTIFKKNKNWGSNLMFLKTTENTDIL